MKNNNLLKLLKSQKPTAGYTLTELLIGASISVVVIGAAGMGLMNLMRGNISASNQTERRTEVNRALEFISDEVRRAETIELDPNNALIIPDADLPSGFDRTKSTIVLALNVPENLGQDTARADDKVIYYVGERPSVGGIPDDKWIGPRVIYRYGPPLDTSGGSYTNGNWVNQPLIDRVNDQALTPGCTGSETAIAAQGFAACVNTSSQKIARVYVNGKFSEQAGDEYQADIQVFARSEAASLSGAVSRVNFNMTKISGQSKVKVIASEMGCSSDQIDYDNGNGSCTIETQIFPTDLLPYDTSTNSYDSTDIATLNNPTNSAMNPISNSGDVDVSVGTDKPFIVRVKPSNDNIPAANRFESYFDDTGAIRTDGVVGEQNNNKSIEVEIDLSKDYVNNPEEVVNVLGDFTNYQVKLLGDKTQISDLPTAWNLDPSNPKFKELVQILGDPNGDGSNDDTLLDSDNELKLEPDQYVLLFEVGQPHDANPTEDINGDGSITDDDQHLGYDLQDHILLITVK